MATDSDSNTSQPVVGRVLGSHGTTGEVRVRILSDVANRFDPGRALLIDGTSHYILSSSHNGRGVAILRLSGITTQSAARSLTNLELTAEADASHQLTEGEYFHYQLMGLAVYTEEGEHLGQISEIIETGSNDVYVVAGPSGDLLIPAISQVVMRVEIAEGYMVVRLLDGLR